MLTKFSRSSILDAQVARSNRLVKSSHKHSFEYTPRKGYLYVRSRAISSRTNDNFDTFPAEEIKKAWQTFVGKPVFVNHHNDDHRRARGVILDAALHEDIAPDGTDDTWVEVLMEIDAVTFPKLAKAILAGDIERTSMGCDVAYSVCSVCGNKATTPMEYCAHIPRLKGQRIRRKTASGNGTEDVLVHEVCHGLSFFENSVLVEDPADPTAFFVGVDDRGVGGGYQGTVTKAAAKTAAPKVQLDTRSYGDQDQYHEVSSFTVEGVRYSVSRGGDAVGQGQYNGYFVAYDPSGRKVGYLDYQQYNGEVQIAMVEVDPDARRKGVATGLLRVAQSELGVADIDPGYLTPDGSAWWGSVSKSSSRKTAASGTFWRVHSKSRPFTLDEAYSVSGNHRLYGGEPHKDPFYRVGFSSIDEPWSLWAYVMAYGWYWDRLVQDSYVIEFSGRPATKNDFRSKMLDNGESEETVDWLLSRTRDASSGPDGESVVIPDFSTVRKMSWQDFEQMLIRTPMPPRPSGHGNALLYPSWEQYIKPLMEHAKSRGFDPGPVLEFAYNKLFGTKVSRKTAGPNDDGDCFSVAWEVADEIGRRFIGGEWPKVCHGTPIFQGSGPISGKPYWHAWVETEDGMVIDWSNGSRIVMPKAQYYSIGQIGNNVHRYTISQAVEFMLSTGHYGPWEDNLVAYASQKGNELFAQEIKRQNEFAWGKARNACFEHIGSGRVRMADENHPCDTCGSTEYRKTSSRDYRRIYRASSFVLAKDDRYKGNTTERGYGWNHQKKREDLLNNHPKCHWCKKKRATEADHTTGGKLVPSCSGCNNKRSHEQKKRKSKK